MKNIRRPNYIVFFIIGLYYHALSCDSFIYPSHHASFTICHHHTSLGFKQSLVMLTPPRLPAARLHFFSKLKLSESDVVDNNNISDNGKETKDKDISLQDRLAGYLPTIRTAFISLCAGSFSVILASILLFRYSLENGDQTIYQTIGRASSSVSSSKKNGKDSAIGQKQAVELYRMILQELDETYVDPVDTNTLFETTTRGVLSTLDPYTEYVSPRVN